RPPAATAIVGRPWLSSSEITKYAAMPTAAASAHITPTVSTLTAPNTSTTSAKPASAMAEPTSVRRLGRRPLCSQSHSTTRSTPPENSSSSATATESLSTAWKNASWQPATARQPNRRTPRQPRPNASHLPRMAKTAGSISATAPIATRQTTAAAGVQPEVMRPLARAPELPKALAEASAMRRPTRRLVDDLAKPPLYVGHAARYRRAPLGGKRPVQQQVDQVPLYSGRRQQFGGRMRLRPGSIQAIESMNASEAIAAVEPAGVAVPYGPGWVDALQARLSRLRWPVWATCAGVWLALVGVEYTGQVLAGTASDAPWPFILLAFALAPYAFAFMDFLDRAAGAALDRLGEPPPSSAWPGGVRYHLMTKPVLGTAIATVAGLTFGLLQRYAVTAPYLEQLGFARSGWLHYYELIA